MSTQIISELVVPGGLVEKSPFPGNLKILSSNHGGGNLTTLTLLRHTRLINPPPPPLGAPEYLNRPFPYSEDARYNPTPTPL